MWTNQSKGESAPCHEVSQPAQSELTALQGPVRHKAYLSMSRNGYSPQSSALP